jgi:mannitol operon transcriptional antiterminator
LADRLGVSARTVHRDLQSASEFLASHDLTLVRQAGRGIKVEGPASARARALEALHKMRSLALTPEERRDSLLGILLGSNEPIKLRALASRWKVSVGTVGRDLDEAEDWLVAFGLSLVRKRGYGVQVLGAEDDCRQAMSQLVLQDLDEAAFLSNPEEAGKHSIGSMNHISGNLMGMVDEERLQTVKTLTREAVESLPYAIADGAFVYLSVHVAVMVERLLRGEEIEMDGEVLQRLRETAEYDNARNLARAIEEYFRLDVPEEEVAYITQHLRGTKLRQDNELDRYFESSDLEIASRVKALIHYVSEQTGVTSPAIAPCIQGFSLT